MSAIKEAQAKGWTINEGTLQARGLWNAFRNNAATHDDLTCWCSSKKEAAEEALRMHEALDKMNAVLDRVICKIRSHYVTLEDEGLDTAELLEVIANRIIDDLKVKSSDRRPIVRA